MAAAERKLAEPVQHFGEEVTRVFLLEPRASHLARHGEPQWPVFNRKTGSEYDVNDDDKIARYIDDLLSVDGKTPDGSGRALYSQLCLADGIAIRDELFGFFVKAKLSLFSSRSTS